MTECAGPELNLSKIESLQKALFSSGSPAKLVMPNPIDALADDLATSSDPGITRALNNFNLPSLLDPNRLDSKFFRVRIKDIDDDLSTLARPNANGEFAYALSDVHYSEAMAYYSIQAISKYVEALGFTYVTSRPLYVMVNAETEEGSTEVNAYYRHNVLDPSRPREMLLFGNTEFAPAKDRDMFWHEMGHFANESVSRERGIDAAGDHGAIYTEAAALHECLADFVAESLADKEFIGKWINRNFEPSRPGQPLRSAVDYPGSKMSYGSISGHDGTGQQPERYTVAEWCTRALWEIRTQLVKEDPEMGRAFADRLALTALSTLGKDTSLLAFQKALVQADNDMHCGFHERSINRAFSIRGFDNDPSEAESLTLSASPVVSGTNVSFRMKMTNPGSETARNVRVKLETSSAALVPDVYLQGYGDVGPGGTVTVGDGGLPLDFSVSGVLSGSSSRIKYRLRVSCDNCEDTVKDGELSR